MILAVISSHRNIDVTAFKNYCFDTAHNYVRKYNWYLMPTSLHVLLIHGYQVIQNFSLPMGMLSEEAQESNNKMLKKNREHFARKTSR